MDRVEPARAAAQPCRVRALQSNWTRLRQTARRARVYCWMVMGRRLMQDPQHTHCQERMPARQTARQP